MSNVKLIVRKRNSLDFGEVTDVVLSLQKSDKVIGIVETDFEPEDDGSVRASDGLDPVVTIENINNLTGKILTFLDASTADPEQRKAAKDLYGQTIWGWYSNLNDGLSRAWRFDKGYETNNPKTGVGNTK